MENADQQVLGTDLLDIDCANFKLLSGINGTTGPEQETTDLGETAADVEIQQHFMITKQAHAAIEVPPALQHGEEFALTSGFQFMSSPSGVQPVRSI